MYKNTRIAVDENDEDDRKDLLATLEIKRKPYRQFEQTYTAQHIHFYLSEDIGEPSGYVDMIYRISTALPGDTIFIHLNTEGGQLDTGVQLINAMQNSQAKIVTILEGVAYSLGTLIFLAGDEMVVNDFCQIMLHNFNGGLVGKGNELTSELNATLKWFTTLAKTIYIPFLTEDEFARISRGEDLWMQSPDIRKRLERMVKQVTPTPHTKPKQPRTKHKPPATKG